MGFRREKGAALTVAVILLLVGLLLSLSSMQSSRLHQSMSSNAVASDRALMAAEYGAAAIAQVIVGKDLDEQTLGNAEEEIRALLGEGELDLDFVSENGGVYYSVSGEGYELPAYFRIEADVGDGLPIGEGVVRVASIGEVFSGVPGAGEVVARRDVIFELAVDFGRVPPLAIPLDCPTDFRLPSNPSGVDGEEDELVQEYLGFRPAIAAGSKRKAANIVREILGSSLPEVLDDNDAPPSISGPGNNRKAVWVESNDGDGAYHASQVVVYDNGAPIGVDYSRNCGANNPMCGYVGGVSSSYGPPSLSSPANFHAFIDSIFRDARGADKVVFHDIDASSINDYEVGKINIFTSNDHHVFASHDDSAIGDLSGRPLVFSDPVEASGEDAGELQVGVQLEGGYFETNIVDVGGGAVPVESLVDFFVIKNNVRHEALVPYPESAYFPSNFDYYQALSGEGLVSVNDGDFSLLIDPSPASSWYDDEGNFVVASPGASAPPEAPAGAEGVWRDTMPFGNNFGSVGDPGTVIVVDGDMDIGTRPVLNGIVIVLGSFDMSGGGPQTNSYLYGSLIVAPYYFDKDAGEFVCQDLKYDTDGGGRFRISYNDAKLREAFSLFSPETIDAWMAGGKLTATLRQWTETVSY